MPTTDPAERTGFAASVTAGFPSAHQRLSIAVADQVRLRKALEEADIVPQLLLATHLSGRSDLLEEARPFVTGGWSYQETIPDALKARIRDRLVDVLNACVADPGALAAPTVDSFREILSAGVGAAIPADYVEFMLEETFEEGVDGRRVEWRQEVPRDTLAAFNVIVVGAGLAGLCMALKLRQAGIPFVVLEKNDAVGGTWYENSYPGAGVDIPFLLICLRTET